MRVLVIGGTGFIGSHIVDQLLSEGLEVVVFDRNPERYRPPLPRVRYVKGELGDRLAINQALAAGIDGVVHAVSSTIPKTSNDDPIFDVQMNLVASLALFDSCVRHNVKKVVFLSSGGTIYGLPQTLPITEEHPTHPLCSYGIVKLAIENYLFFYHQAFGLKYVSLRVSNPYGSRQDPSSVQGAVAVFTHQMMHRKPLTLWGDGSAIRDFVEVRDVARLCYLSMVSDGIGAFNVGSGVGVSLSELIELISKQLGIAPDIRSMPARKFDVPAIILDCQRAKSAFSWSPKIGLAEGLADLAQWMETLSPSECVSEER